MNKLLSPKHNLHHLSNKDVFEVNRPSEMEGNFSDTLRELMMKGQDAPP